MPSLSIIVPIYNSEKYLRECIESILHNTEIDFELLLVDNGSNDNSNAICKEYTIIDDRVTFLSEEHKGVAYARNRGILEAKGEYIGFVDSDDMIDPQMITILYEEMRKGVSMAVCGVYILHPNGLLIEQNCTHKQETFSSLQAQRYALSNKYYKGYLVNKMFRKDIIDRYSIYLDTNISYCEDLLFVIKYLSFATNEVSYSSYPYYYYRIHENNTTEVYSASMLTGIEAFAAMEAIIGNNKMLSIRLQSAKAGIAYYILSKIKTAKIEKSEEREYLKRIIRSNLFAAICSDERSLSTKIKILISCI